MRAWLLVVVVAALVAWAAHGSARTVALAVVAAALIAAWWSRPRPDPERWLRGAAGEEVTARILGALPARRWVVFHDRRIPGSRANLDHVVIGPTGVWVIDTKTQRARAQGRGGCLSMPCGGKPKSSPTGWTPTSARRLPSMPRSRSVPR